MIEFTIPLNLPVRTVEITESTESPSENLIREMARWAGGIRNSSVSHPESFATVISDSDHGHTTSPGHRPDDLQQERESLRLERDFFVQATQELQRATQSIEKQLAGLLLQFQEAAVELGHSIAAKLIFEEVDAGKFPIQNLVHEVVSRLDTSTTTVVRLHPDDLALIDALPTIDGPEGETSIRFVADSALARGDCKAKAGEISVIYELRRQIEEIRRQLLSTVSGHAET